MNWLLSLVGPMLIRMMSSTLLKAVAKVVVNAVIDRAEELLKQNGYPQAAKVLDQIQAELVNEIDAGPVAPSGPGGGGGLLPKIVDRLRGNPPVDQR